MQTVLWLEDLTTGEWKGQKGFQYIPLDWCIKADTSWQRKSKRNVRLAGRRLQAHRSHPPPARWHLFPAAPGPPPSAPSWLPRATACRAEGDGRRRGVKTRGTGGKHLRSCVRVDVRLKSSVGAVDQVPVADLLQDQQGARLVTLTASRGHSQRDGRGRREKKYHSAMFFKELMIYHITTSIS